MARKRTPAAKHAGKHPGSENLRPAPPFGPDHQPAPERRSGGPKPITRWLRSTLSDPKELESLGKALLRLAKQGHTAALNVVVDRTDDALVQRHAVAGVDLSNADDATLDKLEGILERIAPGGLPDA